MTNNEVFKKTILLTRLSYDLELAIEIFRLGGVDISKSRIRALRSNEGERNYHVMSDEEINAFFDGFFVYRDMQSQKSVDIFNVARDEQ